MNNYKDFQELQSIKYTLDIFKDLMKEECFQIKKNLKQLDMIRNIEI